MEKTNEVVEGGKRIVEEFIRRYGRIPKVVSASIQWKDNGEEHLYWISINDVDWEYDEETVWDASSIEELYSLATDKSPADFIVTKFVGVEVG